MSGLSTFHWDHTFHGGVVHRGDGMEFLHHDGFCFKARNDQPRNGYDDGTQQNSTNSHHGSTISNEWMGKEQKHSTHSSFIDDHVQPSDAISFLAHYIAIWVYLKKWRCSNNRNYSAVGHPPCSNKAIIIATSEKDEKSCWIQFQFTVTSHNFPFYVVFLMVAIWVCLNISENSVTMCTLKTIA